MDRRAGSLLAGVTLLGLLWAAPAPGEDRAAPDAKAAFAKMKTLAGEWSAKIDGHGPVNGPQKVVYKLTGAGTTLMETQFPGSDHEMVTMYHLDGDALKVTHYCAAGNQPRMKYDPKASRPGELVFAFDGGSNLDPAKDMHIHGVTFRFRDDKTVDADWEGYMGGKSMGVTKFAMTRQ